MCFSKAKKSLEKKSSNNILSAIRPAKVILICWGSTSSFFKAPVVGHFFRKTSFYKSNTVSHTRLKIETNKSTLIGVLDNMSQLLTDFFNFEF